MACLAIPSRHAWCRDQWDGFPLVLQMARKTWLHTGLHMFNNLTFDPPYVMFSATRKDTTINAETTGCFVWNIATWDLREAMNITSEQVPYGENEFEAANLTQVPSTQLVPMVAESPIRFECTYHTTLRLPGNSPMGTVDIVIGKVIDVHISDSVLTDGLIDLSKVQPIARCGYYSYCHPRDL